MCKHAGTLCPLICSFLLGRNAHSIWAAEQIVIMMSSSRTGKTGGPQRIGFQGDIRRRDGEA